MCYIDELWPGGLKFIKSDEVFPIGTDAVMLSAFIDAANARKAMDIGCGGGIVSLMLAYSSSKIVIDAVDIQQAAADLTRRNAEVNGLSERVNAVCHDIRNYRTFGGGGTYDLVFANPPYFPVNSGAVSARESAAKAREERTCTLDELCAAASFFTRWGGRFALVHRPERMSEVFCGMTAHGIEPKRLRFVHDKLSSPPCLILVEGRRGGKPGLSIEQPLIIRNEDGSFTDELLTIYHRKEAL